MASMSASKVSVEAAGVVEIPLKAVEAVEAVEVVLQPEAVPEAALEIVVVELEQAELEH